MKDEEAQLEALKDIRKMMQDSSKFLSLNGLSGVFAGIYALAGAYMGHRLISNYLLNGPAESVYEQSNRYTYSSLLFSLVLICGAVLVLSLVTALYLSKQKANKHGQRLFDHTSIKLFWCMAIPLCTGGLFCLALLANGLAIMICPAMLLFYGLALLNSSRFTHIDIKYLGYAQIIMGLIAAFFPGHGLLFWAMGFGGLHIIYGSIAWYKYDRH